MVVMQRRHVTAYGRKKRGILMRVASCARVPRAAANRVRSSRRAPRHVRPRSARIQIRRPRRRRRRSGAPRCRARRRRTASVPSSSGSHRSGSSTKGADNLRAHSGDRSDGGQCLRGGDFPVREHGKQLCRPAPGGRMDGRFREQRLEARPDPHQLRPGCVEELVRQAVDAGWELARELVGAIRRRTRANRGRRAAG